MVASDIDRYMTVPIAPARQAGGNQHGKHHHVAQRNHAEDERWGCFSVEARCAAATATAVPRTIMMGADDAPPRPRRPGEWGCQDS
jgi:hypothetical protein